jgi:putative membrane protein
LLKVQYTVRNVTGRSQHVTFDDGTGHSTSATEDVVIPMVGSLSTVLPSTFTDVRSAEANMAGDGRGGTKMSFTMTLFGPIGKPEATFGYEAQVSDGVVPKATISALRVSPLDSPWFMGGAQSYMGGAQTGATLTAGATEIDRNLLKLRDGAADLLAGLIKLRSGADQLHDGLAGQAAPGAASLAAGAHRLKDGTGQLVSGAATAKAGSAQVADGARQWQVGRPSSATVPRRWTVAPASSWTG